MGVIAFVSYIFFNPAVEQQEASVVHRYVSRHMMQHSWEEGEERERERERRK